VRFERINAEDGTKVTFAKVDILNPVYSKTQQSRSNSSSESGGGYCASAKPDENIMYTALGPLMKGYILICTGEDNRKRFALHSETELMEYDNNGELITYKNNEKHISVKKQNDSKIFTDVLTGKRLILCYNKDGLVTEVKDDNGRSTSFTYDNGYLTSYTDIAGNITNYIYDDNGRIISAAINGKQYVKNKYNSSGDVVRQRVGENLNYINFEYSYNYMLNEKEIKITDEAGNVSYVYCDIFNRIKKIVNERGGVTQYEYDNNGNLIKETDGLGNSINKQYDSNDNLIRTTDQYGKSTIMKYDTMGNILEVKNSNGSNSTYDYINKNVIRFQYDNDDSLNSNKIFEFNGVSVKIISDYSEKEAKIRVLNKSTDFSGKVTIYDYDDYGRIISEKLKVSARKDTNTLTEC